MSDTVKLILALVVWVSASGCLMRWPGFDRDVLANDDPDSTT